MTLVCLEIRGASQTRSVMLKDGLPVGAYIESPLRRALLLGEAADGVAGVAGPHGWTATLHGQTVFVRGKPPPGVSAGAPVALRIVAEAQTGKPARAVAERGDAASGAAAWRLTYREHDPETLGVASMSGADRCIEAMEAALSGVHSLGGGAALRLHPTPAGIVADVDTGPSAVKAANERGVARLPSAVFAAGLGGTVYMDLAGSPRAAALNRLLDAAKQATQALRPGRVMAEGLSRSGTLVLALPRREAPLSQQLAAPGLQGAWMAERELCARPMDRLRLLLRTADDALAASLTSLLQGRYGPRVRVEADDELGTVWELREQ